MAGCTNCLPVNKSNSHLNSKETIAAVNHWRCDGFPLYGQDLIKSLTITNSVKPVQSRYTGQGYVNCLNTSLDSPVEEVSVWRPWQLQWTGTCQHLDMFCSSPSYCLSVFHSQRGLE